MFLNKKGFTLIELLLVIVIISILVAAVLVAIDPAKRLADTRDSRRWEDMRSLLDTVLKYMVDNEGDYPNGIDATTTSSQVLGTSVSGCDTTCTATTTVSACLDFGPSAIGLVGPYIAKIPFDPKTGSNANTDYYINKTLDGRIKIGTCDPENFSEIYVER
jgi:prepilin-type N-terminal cleavage/methylation domain-containing protein